jgi:signal transduction histidine kinase
MKLFTRYSRINVLATIIIFLTASAAFYFTLRYVLMQQIDDDLKIEEREIKVYVQKHGRLPESISVKDQVIHYLPLGHPVQERYFTTSFLRDGQEHDEEPFRQLVFTIEADQKWYRVTVSKSLEDTDALIHSILLITSGTILAILIFSFVINRVVLKRIWKPFYRSLDKVKEFKVGKDQNLVFPPTGIDEFRLMNQTLERITRQAQTDYLSLKTFSENASHEIQTPIAIIRSKLDLLIQDEHLSEQQSQTVQSAYNAVHKLTKLNQSLLLLARIENNQYQALHKIDLRTCLEEKLADFQELWQSQQICVEASLENTMVQMNGELADILLNNLLSNATKHNFPGGKVLVHLREGHLLVANTSREGGLDPQKIFQRFYKPSQVNEHNGLGLSIIRQICEASGFKVGYSFDSGIHSFSVSWT